MTNTSELYGENGLMTTLLSTECIVEGGEVRFTERGKAIVKEIAEYARSKPIYNKTADERKKCWGEPETRTVYNVWMHILNKICDAPFDLYREMAIVLNMPVLDELLNGTEG